MSALSNAIEDFFADNSGERGRLKHLRWRVEYLENRILHGPPALAGRGSLDDQLKKARERLEKEGSE